ncbi:hypothetical protein [Gloeobacter kilaueensis]|uniref:Uncharacterized protein n=1 Tax=Gloeobacter kilaueensis (strain ATCC BAA-2537 / CCAP 1431/1 / ULC 316 / JS1) TaxID=1183438 RepID=U5QJW9_GLOK1|nr:hypothetical protein [Gloeobacter kilaueensis]AGY57955.1 hypothetical protein GKIL_1709 [Gloeobacter kilaueensis JS1]
MHSWIPILIVYAPLALIAGMVFRSKRPWLLRWTTAAGLVCLWGFILLALTVSRSLPPISEVLVKSAAFGLPLALIWFTHSLSWTGRFERRAQWGATAIWIALWYLLLDPTGLSLITWIVVWPVVGFAIWKAYDLQGPARFSSRIIGAIKSILKIGQRQSLR